MWVVGWGEGLFSYMAVIVVCMKHFVLHFVCVKSAVKNKDWLNSVSSVLCKFLFGSTNFIDVFFKELIYWWLQADLRELFP